ncbi:autotransporter domain-containing protein [Mesorhizobium sp. BAC0120]|uniref:autotransporter domain-containing protein n=1 Tax=Mesorhizobium sp. BAC0120 TaxID=3090670 RepID=UPI00298CAD87|nr:autotransporter domain-containing protein [Mesorhizobium sp. BAC0120]MDW6022703.1 autotransporter domain-containing protein [Mesorhizobium sp. BAC0120]
MKRRHVQPRLIHDNVAAALPSPFNRFKLSTALAGSLLLMASSAFAQAAGGDGGDGDAGFGGSGGTAGAGGVAGTDGGAAAFGNGGGGGGSNDAAGGNGGNGASNSPYGGGGGGGGGGSGVGGGGGGGGGSSGSGSAGIGGGAGDIAISTNSGTIQGRSGSNGGGGSGGGGAGIGGGGGGGSGGGSSGGGAGGGVGDITVSTNSGTIQGGDGGGIGGVGIRVGGGAGIGGGGAGSGGGGGGGRGGDVGNIVVSANSGTIQGGSGGLRGGDGIGSGGEGSLFDGGAVAGSIYLNNTSAGVVRGGNGWGAGFGGAGVRGQNATIVNAGTIAGGLNGNGSQAAAMVLTGGANSLRLVGTNWSLVGDIQVNVSSSLSFTQTDNQTLANTISGNGAVIQNGSGTLRLSGANTYTGGTTIDAGTLQVSADNNLGAASGGLVFNDGTLAATGSFDTSRSVTLAATGGVDVAGNMTLGLTGAITGAGDLIKRGAGTLRLSGANTYAGGTTIDAGTLQVSADNNLGAASGGLVFNDGTLAATGSFDSSRSVTLAATGGFDVAANVTLGLTGAITGAGDLIKRGAGTLTLSGTNTYIGGTTIDAGTLQVSADNNLGAASGGLVFNDATLAATGSFDTSRSVTLAATGGFDVAANVTLGLTGAITGAGDLIKRGAGTLRLSGANTYAGGTTIDAGTLQVSANSNLGAANGGLVFNDGTLAATGSFDTSRSVTLAATGGFDVAANVTLGLTGAITGAGDLIKRGAGTLRLDNTGNSYGNTFVAAGTLIGNSASVSGNVGNAGTLIFDETTNGIFGGAIAGFNGTNGAVIKRGAGVLTLAGTSNLDWTISAGGLVTTAERFSGNADIASGASLTFNQLVNAAWGGVLTGTGNFVKTGSGTFLYDGQSASFAGTTNVAAGSLIVGSDTTHAGAVLGGSMNVLKDAALGGHGTVGSGVGSLVTIAPGGMLLPGNSIGTLTINGDLVLNQGSVFAVEVGPASTASDLVHVIGTATLRGGSVAHIGAGGTYNPHSTYTILSADSGLNGAFTGVTSNFAFLHPWLSYDPNSVYLTLARNDVAFASAAATRNQRSTANAIDSIGFAAGNPLYDAIVQLPDDDAMLRRSFDALSGEIHASAKTALIEDSHFVRDAAIDRIRSAFGDVAVSSVPVMSYVEGSPRFTAAAAPAERFSIWGYGFGSWGQASGDGNAERLNYDTGGFLAGIDAPVFDTWRFGILGGYSRTSFNVKDRASSGSSDNYHLGLYGGTQQGNLGFRTGAAYTWHDLETARSVAFPGFADSLKGSYNAGIFQAFGDVGYRIDTSAVSLEPFANLAYVSLNTGSFGEQGGAAALHAEGQSTNTTLTTLGLRASATFDLGGVSTTARGSLGWQHAFGDTTVLSAQAFSAGDAFTVAGVSIAKDAAVAEAGLDLRLTPSATFGIFYQGQVAADAQEHGLQANLKLQF